MAKRATVPLDIAEFLRVTLQIAKQSEKLDSEAKARIGTVLAMYECGRDEWLLNLGYTQKQIDGMAKSAALALANRFDDLANSTIEHGSTIPVIGELPPVDELVDMTEFEQMMQEDDGSP